MQAIIAVATAFCSILFLSKKIILQGSFGIILFIMIRDMTFVMVKLHVIHGTVIVKNG